MTPHLADADRRRHWDHLIDAANWQLTLDDPRTGATAALKLLDNTPFAEGSTGDLLDLDPESYRAVNHADRAGENDYDGYDTALLALDLASRWDTERGQQARELADQTP